MSRSTARSAAVTRSVAVLFVPTSPIPSARRATASAAARRATSTATASSSSRSASPIPLLPSAGSIPSAGPGVILAAGGPATTRDDRDERRYNSRLPTCLRRKPAGPGINIRTSPVSARRRRSPGRRRGAFAGRAAGLATGRSFVTETRQDPDLRRSGADVQSITDALIAHAAASGGQLTSTEVGASARGGSGEPARGQEGAARADRGRRARLRHHRRPTEGGRRPHGHGLLAGRHRAGHRRGGGRRDRTARGEAGPPALDRQARRG